MGKHIFSHLIDLKSYGMTILPKCILHPHFDSKTSLMHDMWHLQHKSQQFTCRYAPPTFTD